MEAFCVGEPWNAQLVHQNIGFSAMTTGELWKDHPEKSFAMRADSVEKHPKAARALTMAVMEAQMWCDANLADMCKIIAGREWLKVPVEDIAERSLGTIDYGDGRKTAESPLAMKYWRDFASYPFQSHDLLVPHREPALGLSARQPRRQGAHRRGQSRGRLARRRQGAGTARGRSPHRPRAAWRPFSTARHSIRQIRRPIWPAWRSNGPWRERRRR